MYQEDRGGLRPACLEVDGFLVNTAMPSLRNRFSLAVQLWVSVAILVAFGMTPTLYASEGSAWVPTRASNDANTRKGFDNFYNLEYDKSIRDFEAALQAHPDDPFAVNHLLSAVVFKELYRSGALDTEAYATDNFLNKKNLQPLDPKVHDRVNQLSARSTELSDSLLAKNPNDVNALYARSVARGLKSTYMGMAEHAWFAALRSALAARHDDERVLELDPNYVDAKALLGIHLYVIGSLSWPAKVAASMIGISGNKKKGLEYLREVAAHGNPEVAWDAKIALALFLRREQMYDEALQVVGGMYQAFPRNFLIATEYAHLLNAAGHGPQAVAAYQKIVAGCRSNAFTVCRIEIPAYGLGEAMKGQRDFQGAEAAYELAASAAVDPDFRQRAMLNAGEMYDAMQKRDAALAKYKEVIAANSGTESAELARHYMKQAYTIE
jgi:tetratricopeptide (TPR) repeat protein